MTTYPLASQGVFATIQGEGAMMGEPMVFVRFAGCPVGCLECDTDYRLVERVDLDALTRRVMALDSVRIKWVWLTGGEPTIHDLDSIVGNLQRYGYRVAVATAGIKPVNVGRFYGGVDFVSVSPHAIDSTWVQRAGDQLNIVPGLNGLKLADLESIDVSGFTHRYVTPMWYAPGERMERVAECVEWVRSHAGWRLGVQAHKAWGVA